MNDDGPWFTRWLGFVPYPISWKGWVTNVLFVTIEISIDLLSMGLSPDSLLWWLSSVVLFGTFLVYWAIAEWRMDNGF